MGLGSQKSGARRCCDRAGLYLSCSARDDCRHGNHNRIMSTIQKTLAERRVYDGARVKRGYKVTSIEVCKEDPGTVPTEIVKVSSYDEYTSGCRQHPRCIGHMCLTPENNLLPFHGLSLASSDTVTQYMFATKDAFVGNAQSYKAKLAATNKGKRGHLRSILKTPVSGSARLVVTPHVDDNIGHIYVSEQLARKITFCAAGKNVGETNSATFVERTLQEGDYVLLNRPPSLTIYNSQPLRVKFWDRETLGIHPEVFSQLGGDFDGDEGHIYPLALPLSLKEAESWQIPPFPKFDAARSRFSSMGLGNSLTNTIQGNMEFMEYTTLSAAQILSSDDVLELGNLTRNSDNFVSMLGARMRATNCADTFVTDSVQAVKDVMRQQLGQGRIGYLTRVAKIAMMNVVRSNQGGTYIVNSVGRQLVLKDTEPSSGSPAVRATISLCGVAQQSELNAHKVGESASTSFDFVSSLFLGRHATPGNNAVMSRTPVNTLYVMRSTIPSTVIDEMKPMWRYPSETQTIVIAMDNYCGVGLKYCIGAYSPVVLDNIGLAYGETIDLCHRALRVIYTYNSVGTEGDDLLDVAAGFAYEIGKSVYPVTSSSGLAARNLGWTERVMGCDLRLLGQISGNIEAPLSSTSATVMSNFDYLGSF